MVRNWWCLHLFFLPRMMNWNHYQQNIWNECIKDYYYSWMLGQKCIFCYCAYFTNDDMYEREYRRHPQWVKYEENLMYLSHNVNLGFVRKLMTSWILLGRVTDRFTAHDWLNPFVLFLGIENGRCKRASLCASPVIVTSHADDPWWTEIKCAVHEHADTQAEED